MVHRLYWDDAYLREFDSSVERVDGNRVYLESTAFLPQGGGFIGDTGTLGGFRVSDTRIDEEGRICHFTEEVSNLRGGDTVRGILDWEKRYRSMKMHTTAHALSAVFNRMAGAKITGNQIRPDISRIDFSLERMDRGIMTAFVEQVNAVIKTNPQVKTYFLPKEEAAKIPDVVKLAGTAPPDTDTVRIVEIEGFDIQACGGVNVKSFGEVGSVRAVSLENKGRNNRRLYFSVEE